MKRKLIRFLLLAAPLFLAYYKKNHELTAGIPKLNTVDSKMATTASATTCYETLEPDGNNVLVDE